MSQNDGIDNADSVYCNAIRCIILYNLQFIPITNLTDTVLKRLVQMMNYQFISEIIKNALNISDFNVSETQSGFSKQVYKITSKAGNFILYVWSRPYDNKLTENLTRRAEYLFPDGFTYFVHNTKLLTDIGIRVPYIITYGHHDDGDFDYAVVEYFEGQDLYEYMNNGGNIGNIADRITAVMDKMALNKRSFYGPPIEKEPNNISHETACI